MPGIALRLDDPLFVLLVLWNHWRLQPSGCVFGTCLERPFPTTGSLNGSKQAARVREDFIYILVLLLVRDSMIPGPVLNGLPG
ncbi:MAG: hypothetical protein JXA13_02815 [Anaerolineales bacterium]|nr:hypothetical protein [Anaerolineales bacterium]